MRTAIVLVLALAACGGEDLPTTDELHGSWTNEEEDTIRNFVFAETAGEDTYEVCLYPSGTTPTLVQSGTYYVQDGTLVTVVSPQEMYGNEIVGWTGDTLTLAVESAASGQRTFTRD